MNYKGTFSSKDSKAITYFYDKYFSSVYAFAVSIIKDDDEAKDIVQKSYIKIWDGCITFKSGNSFKAYLYNSVKNMCIDYLRKKSKLTDKEVEKIAFNIEDKVIENEILTHIYLAIEKLPKVRRSIILSQIQGMSIEDIAGKFDISPSTVKVHLSLAKKDLKKSLKDLYPIFCIFFNF